MGTANDISLAGSFVYVVQATSGTGPVKIGYTSRRPSTRLKAIQANSPVPLTFVGGFVGTEYHEAMLHLRVKAHRLHGEWFDPAALVEIADELDLTAAQMLAI